MNIQKVLLGTLLVQPELAPCVLPVLEISDFEPDIQPIFAAAQGFWTATGKLETVQLCTRYPALKAAIMGCADEYSAECIHPNRENVLAWVRMQTQFCCCPMMGNGTGPAWTRIRKVVSVFF